MYDTFCRYCRIWMASSKPANTWHLILHATPSASNPAGDDYSKFSRLPVPRMRIRAKGMVDHLFYPVAKDLAEALGCVMVSTPQLPMLGQSPVHSLPRCNTILVLALTSGNRYFDNERNTRYGISRTYFGIPKGGLMDTTKKGTLYLAVTVQITHRLDGHRMAGFELIIARVPVFLRKGMADSTKETSGYGVQGRFPVPTI